MSNLQDFTDTYADRSLVELAYLAQTYSGLDGVLDALSPSIGLGEPAMQSAEANFRRLLQQNILYISREIHKQALEAKPSSEGESK